jgi:hypothetical protein
MRNDLCFLGRLTENGEKVAGEAHEGLGKENGTRKAGRRPRVAANAFRCSAPNRKKNKNTSRLPRSIDKRQTYLLRRSIIYRAAAIIFLPFFVAKPSTSARDMS